MEIIEATPKDKYWIKKIYHFQLKLYKKSKHFIPNLKMDVLGGLGQAGVLDYRNPFHKKAKVVYFIVKKNEEILGTIAAINHYTYNNYHNEKIGFFGFFEFIEDFQVFKILLDKASEWLKNEGLNYIRGPFSFDTNGMIGLLIHGFDSKPFFQTAYNYPYYEEFFQQYGLHKDKDIISLLLPVLLPKEIEMLRQKRLSRVVNKIYENAPNIRIEELDMKNYQKQFEDIKLVINQAWASNWGYVPLIDEEFQALAESLKIIANAKLILIAYVDDKPAGFIGVLPDVYSVTGRCKWMPEIIKLIYAVIKIKLTKISRLRLMLFGVIEEYRKIGLDALLFARLFKAAQKKKCTECELSWILEDNLITINAGKRLQATHSKTWRIFGKSL